MTRGQYIVRRLVQMIPVLLGITIIIFLLLRLIPGDPATALLGDRATDQVALAHMRQHMGLDKPIWIQYLYYMHDLVRGNLGESLRYRVPVSALLGQRVLVSLSIAAYTTVLSSLIALPLGILAALKKDSLLDNVVRSVLMVTMVMPSFWIGIIFIIVLSVNLRLFPASGLGDGLLGHLRHLFLPTLTLSLGLAPLLIRSLRASILEALAADYVKTARAKGLAERAVITAHVLRNALIPAITLLGLSVGYLMSGTVITEKVFAIPGAGALLVDSIGTRDYPTVQSATLVFALLVVLVNLVTDLAYTFLDPRLRLS